MIRLMFEALTLGRFFEVGPSAWSIVVSRSRDAVPAGNSTSFNVGQVSAAMDRGVIQSAWCRRLDHPQSAENPGLPSTTARAMMARHRACPPELLPPGPMRPASRPGPNPRLPIAGC